MDGCRVCIRVDQDANRYIEAMSFADSDVFVVSTDGNHGIWSTAHIADTLKVTGKLLAFAVEGSKFLFAHGLEFRHFLDVFEVVEAFDALADGAHVGEHAAEPTVVDIELSCSFSSFFDRFLCLAFAANEEDFLVALGEVCEECASLIEAAFCFFEIDDMNAVLVLQQVLFHIRMPFARLVSKMYTCVNHFVDQFVNHICM